MEVEHFFLLETGTSRLFALQCTANPKTRILGSHINDEYFANNEPQHLFFDYDQNGEWNFDFTPIFHKTALFTLLDAKKQQQQALVTTLVDLRRNGMRKKSAKLYILAPTAKHALQPIKSASALVASIQSVVLISYSTAGRSGGKDDTYTGVNICCSRRELVIEVHEIEHIHKRGIMLS